MGTPKEGQEMSWQEVASCQPKTRDRPATILILDFWSPELSENKFLSFQALSILLYHAWANEYSWLYKFLCCLHCDLPGVYSLPCATLSDRESRTWSEEGHLYPPLSPAWKPCSKKYLLRKSQGGKCLAVMSESRVTGRSGSERSLHFQRELGTGFKEKALRGSTRASPLIPL